MWCVKSVVSPNNIFFSPKLLCEHHWHRCGSLINWLLFILCSSAVLKQRPFGKVSSISMELNSAFLTALSSPELSDTFIIKNEKQYSNYRNSHASTLTQWVKTGASKSQHEVLVSLLDDSPVASQVRSVAAEMYSGSGLCILLPDLARFLDYEVQSGQFQLQDFRLAVN